MNDLPQDSNSPQGFSISSLVQSGPQGTSSTSSGDASDDSSQTASQQVPSDSAPISEVSISPQLKGDADDVEVQNILAGATQGAISEAKNEAPVVEQPEVSSENPVPEANIAQESSPINEVKIEDSGKDANLDLDSSNVPSSVVFNS
ncbi:hypothetical protein CO178_00915, partial [candidate division WWE3 bacterium CG_4_9_14_3_um_filter_34_6]